MSGRNRSTLEGHIFKHILDKDDYSISTHQPQGAATLYILVTDDYGKHHPAVSTTDVWLDRDGKMLKVLTDELTLRSFLMQHCICVKNPLEIKSMKMALL